MLLAPPSKSWHLDTSPQSESASTKWKRKMKILPEFSGRGKGEGHSRYCTARFNKVSFRHVSSLPCPQFPSMSTASTPSPSCPQLQSLLSPHPYTFHFSVHGRSPIFLGQKGLARNACSFFVTDHFFCLIQTRVCVSARMCVHVCAHIFCTRY